MAFEVHAPVQSAEKADVARRAEHDRVSGRRTTERTPGRIRLLVGFDIDGDAAEPVHEKVAPIRSGAASCTLLAKNDLSIVAPDLRVRPEAPSRRSRPFERSQCAGGIECFHVGRGIETITPRYLCGHVPKPNIVVIFQHRSGALARPHPQQRWSTPLDGAPFCVVTMNDGISNDRRRTT